MDIVADGPYYANACYEKILAGQGCVLGEQRFRTRNRDILYVEVSASMIRFKGRDTIFSIIAHDITERKKAESALFIANKKLNLLGSVTRHDILNNLTVLLGYLSIIRNKNIDPAFEEYLKRSSGAAESIHKQIEFTRTYQNLGVMAPVWQDIGKIVSGLDGKEIGISAELKGLEIYADPLLEKVFYNLYDNSLRHGEKVTAINVHFALIPEGLFLFWEDNGIGVPVTKKEGIFERGRGGEYRYGTFPRPGDPQYH